MTEGDGTRQALADLESFRDACDDLLEHARRTLRIVAPHLDLSLLSRAAVSTRLADMTRISRFTDIRILFSDSLLAMKHGHRLIELARRFPSYINMRQLPQDLRDMADAWMLADDQALLWRPDHHRYANGLYVTENSSEATRLCRHFDDWWERSQPDPELRQLYL